MRVVITGGGGFLGRKLAARLLKDGSLVDSGGTRRTIREIVLFDQIAPPDEETVDERISVVVGDLTDAGTVDELIAPGTDSIFHLASVVSAGAEADFDLGYQVNMDGTRTILEAARALGTRPKVVFASSIAVYGGDIPETVTDDTILTPETSYGAHKATGELLITDFTRKGYIDGRAMRLPTIVVRPGKPNAAASGFASGIIREPLNGIDFVCPVTPESKMAIMSPRTVIDCFVHMHDLDSDDLGPSKALLLTGFSVSMGDTAAAVAKHAGNRKVGAITFEIDDHIQAIVDAWPKESYSERAAKLGFPKDDDINEIIRAHIEDELGG
jgi:nucleoside-diphosphate-sugar epimerase